MRHKYLSTNLLESFFASVCGCAAAASFFSSGGGLQRCCSAVEDDEAASSSFTGLVSFSGEAMKNDHTADFFFLFFSWSHFQKEIRSREGFKGTFSCTSHLKQVQGKKVLQKCAQKEGSIYDFMYIFNNLLLPMVMVMHSLA